MLGQKDDLSHVSGVMSQLAVDRLKDGMRLLANHHGSHYIFRLQRLNRVENESPAPLPTFDHFGARCICVNDELLVTITIWLFTVASQKIHPPRAHVASQMLDDDRHAIAFGIERDEELVVIELFHRAVAQLLQEA